MEFSAFIGTYDDMLQRDTRILKCISLVFAKKTNQSLFQDALKISHWLANTTSSKIESKHIRLREYDGVVPVTEGADDHDLCENAEDIATVIALRENL